MRLKEKIVGSVTILILSIVFLIFGFFSNKNDDVDFEEVFSKEEETLQIIPEGREAEVEDNSVLESKPIIVDIKGAVKNPREYELEEGARIRDLIEAAGGLTEEADDERIKFSQVLKDEDCIKIYKIGEGVDEGTMTFTETSGENSSSESSSGKININKASMTELQSLPGIGEVKAQSIIDYRESIGRFKSVDDLTNITGIGSKTVDKLRDMVDIK